MGENFAVNHGLSTGLFPVGIADEPAPIGASLLLALVGDDVGKRIGLTLGLVRRRPVGDVSHTVFLKQRTGVVAETGVEIIQSILRRHKCVAKHAAALSWLHLRRVIHCA